MSISPWVVVGGLGVTALAVAAYANRHVEDVPPRKAVLREGVRDRKVGRSLDSIDRRKDVLDERYLRLRDQRRAAEARAQAALTPKAKRRALGVVTRLKEREELIHRQADRLEERYQGITAGTIRVNPSPDPELAAAMAASERFHGTPDEVIELSPEEQRVSRYVVALGTQPELDYEPDKDSSRTGYDWQHQVGDRGDFLPKGPGKAILAWDLVHRKPVTVLMGSEMTLDTSRGLIG